MASPSKQAALLDMCHNRVKSYAESKYNTSKYFQGKEDPDNYKAAVLVPLFVKEGSLRVLLTLRSEQLPTHKGQVAFPGGKEEDGDKDIVATALREAEEEVGLPHDIVEVVAVLSPLLSRARHKDMYMYVYPVIGIIKSDFDLVINTCEVQTTFDVPLEFFLLKDTHRQDTMIFEGKEIVINLFDYETNAGDQTRSSSFIIWGLTATICLKVAVTVLNKLPDFELDEDYSDLVEYISELNSQKNDFKCLSKI